MICSMRLVNSILCTGLLAFVLTPLAGAATASLSDKLPVDKILIDSGGPSHASANVQFNRTINMDRFGGAAFSLPADSTLEAATFHVHGIGEGAASGQAIISVVTFGDLSEESIKKYPFEVVATEGVTLPADMQADKFLTIRFAKPVTLKKGQYGLVFQWAKPGQGREINFRTSQQANGSWFFRLTMNKDGDLIKQDIAGGSAGRGLFIVLQGEKSNP